MRSATSNLVDLMVYLLGDSASELLPCLGADEARSKSPARESGRGKPRRSPQERAFKAAKKAVQEGNLNALSRLVKTASQANWYASDRAWCLLDEAVKSRSPAMVKWLLEKGANPNTLFFRDKQYDLSKGVVPGGYFSPFATAISNAEKQIVELMLDHGADINLPVVYEDESDHTTCRDLAQESGIWPWIEAYLIGKAVGDTEAASHAKRL
jgi:ankyrin repeat protein